MEKFITAGYRDINVHKLNIIRMQLKAISIADISTADGKRISSEAWHAQNGNGLRDGFKWPSNQFQIPNSWKQLWQRALLRSICPVYTRPGQRVLHYTLGYWYGDQYLSKWNTYL